MFCPSCGYLLQKIKVTTTSGGRFEIDHCGRCGGTWFDPYEINRIPYHEVVRLAHLTVLPKKLPHQTPSPVCPYCHKTLEYFNSESVPAGLKLLRCPKDRGIWATQKALEEFKSYQEKTIIEYKTRKAAFPQLSVVFIPALFVFLLFVSTFITVTHLQEAKEERVKATALISQLQVTSIAPTSISLIFQTKAALRSNISYGASILKLTTKPISEESTTSHGIFLTNLEPDTLYLYRVTLVDEEGRAFTSEEKSFITGK